MMEKPHHFYAFHESLSHACSTFTKGLSLYLCMDRIFKDANNGQMQVPGSNFSRGVHIWCKRLRHYYHFTSFAKRYNDRNYSITEALWQDNNTKSGSKQKQAPDANFIIRNISQNKLYTSLSIIEVSQCWISSWDFARHDLNVSIVSRQNGTFKCFVFFNRDRFNKPLFSNLFHSS